jgi:hypothetical protein
VEAAVAKARGFEHGNDFARAIDAYLSVQPGDSGSADALQQCWRQAAALAVAHQRHRAAEVVAAAAGRLAGIGRHEAAAELFESVDDVQGGPCCAPGCCRLLAQPPFRLTRALLTQAAPRTHGTRRASLWPQLLAA